MLETLPADPARAGFRPGGTFGKERKHRFRAKFGGQRFRLFFRYGAAAKAIICSWVNDGKALRTVGSKTDAYPVFRAPPDGWEALVRAAVEVGEER